MVFESMMVLKMASIVNYDLRFEISNLNYRDIDVHIAYSVWGGL